MDTDPFDLVADRVRAADFAGASAALEERLRARPPSPFEAALGAAFKNDPCEVAAHVARFVAACQRSFPVAAVYLEMNGFDINPDRWCFDAFGYRTVPDLGDLDTLCEWDSAPWETLALTGMEPVQAVYDWYSGHRTRGYKQPGTRETATIASILVLCRFLELVERAARTGGLPAGLVVLATAHDYDIIGRFQTPPLAAEA